MGTLVPKYRFVNSSLISVHFTNGMGWRPFPMAQATGITCFCESSSQLVHAHRDSFPLRRVSGFAVCTTWPPTLESGWNSHLNKLASCPHCRCHFTSEFPVLRFAQFGLHIRNLKGSRLQAGRPTVHILCHSLPGFRFCGLCSMASTCAIWMEFTFKHDGLMCTFFTIHFRVSGFAVGALWHPHSKSERNSPLQTAGQTPSTTKF